MSRNNNIKEASRFGYSWSIPEILNLQREHELLGLPIPEIARRHFRTENAIIAKIENENFDRIEQPNQHIYRLRSTHPVSLALFLCIPLFLICASYFPSIKDSYPY